MIEKLKRPRDSLLRAIRAGAPAPQGYMTSADLQREQEEKKKRAKEKRRAA